MFVVFVQLAVSALVYASGFRAVSDDDYARVVIAQGFAENPSWDPSGTSWLPLPFQLQGLALLIFDAKLEIARAAALCAGVAAALLLYATARAAGIPRGRATLAPIGLSLLPTFAPLGVATVPEYPTAALLAWGTVSLRGGGLWRLSGAFALFCATASRYEAWPVAATFAALSLLDAARERSGRAIFVLSAFVALAFPAAWMLHGALHHGSASFFVTRVAAYKAALSGASGLEALWSYPLAWFTREPELAWLTLASLALAWFARGRAPARGGPPAERGAPPEEHGGARSDARRRALCEITHDWGARPWLVAAALLFFLVLGDVRGGAPTHHPERALLLLWILGGLTFLRYSEALGRRTLGALLGAALLIGLPVRLATERGAYAERNEEEAIGRLVREHLKPTERVVVGTTDFGYFAIEAAAGAPGRFLIAASHDPREQSAPTPLPLRVAALARAEEICFAVVPLCVEVPGARVELETADFQLVRFDAPGCAARE